MPVRTVRSFPNKPWITSKIKGLLNLKKDTFKAGDRGRRVQHYLKKRPEGTTRRGWEETTAQQNKRGVEGHEGHHWLQGEEVTPGDTNMANEINHVYRLDTAAALVSSPACSCSTCAAVISCRRNQAFGLDGF